MKRLYQLITFAWQFGKNVYENPPKSQKDWLVTQEVRRQFCSMVQEPKEIVFLRAVTSAILDYYEAENNEK